MPILNEFQIGAIKRVATKTQDAIEAITDISNDCSKLVENQPKGTKNRDCALNTMSDLNTITYLYDSALEHLNKIIKNSGGQK